MFFSGISDEAGQGIDNQIKAHRELGWTHLELRMIDGQNLTMLPDAAFDAVFEKVTAAGMNVSCFASAIANWARPITCDPNIDIEDLKRAIPRMHRFGTPFIRVMSYPNDKDHPLPEPEWRREAIRRMKTLAKIAEDGGVTLAHENCSGWGGLSAENSNILLGEVNSPALKVVLTRAIRRPTGRTPGTTTKPSTRTSCTSTSRTRASWRTRKSTRTAARATDTSRRSYATCSQKDTTADFRSSRTWPRSFTQAKRPTPNNISTSRTLNTAAG